jgi:hypothetical protein
VVPIDIISEAKRLRKKLHNITENRNDLLIHKQQFEAIMDDAPGHWEWDEITDCYITFSEQYANIHGMTSKQMLEIDSIEKALKLVCDDADLC